MTKRPTNTAQRLTFAGVMLAMLVGVCLGFSVSTFDYAEGTSYLSNDPKACVNCHIMRDQFDSWQKSPHHAHATCNDCHVPNDSVLAKFYVKAEHGYRHSKGFTLQNFHEPIQITKESLTVVQDNCLRCHGELVSESAASHVHGSKGMDCTHCHAGIGHGPRR
jgi:cytochrome c nitrite reductase small subunit